MRGIRTFAALVLSGGLAGCTAAAPPPQPAPLVAVPGPTKTEAEFRQDDTACRAAAALPANPSPPSARPAAASTPTAAPSNGQATNSDAAQVQEAPPGLVYLRCMEARQNVVQPLVPAQPVLYGYYAPYPIYDSYPFYYRGYPFFYGGFGVGFFGGGYGRHYGGFHHHGFHGGGFHGGGFGHGGFHHR